jgi:hypothetical protein
MRFDNLVAWHAGLALQAVDILSKKLEQQAFLVQQVDERVGDCRSVFPWVQLLRKCVEGQWVFAEEGQLEDCFGVGEVQALEVRVQASLW